MLDQIKQGSSASRRGFMQGAAALGLGLGLAPALAARAHEGHQEQPAHQGHHPAAAPVAPLATRTSARIAWMPLGMCVAAVPVAKEKGFFEKYNLDAELVGFRTHNDEMIQSTATGKADVAVAMMANWLLPIQNGLPARVFATTHGGCVRIVGSRKAGVLKLADLRGKRILIPDIPGPATGLFSILLSANGIDPNKDVTWVRTALPRLGEAMLAGEAEALAQIDPQVYSIQHSNPDLVELTSNEVGPFKDRSCCIAVAGQAFLDAKPDAARVVAAALADAAEWTMANPDETAAIYAGKTGYSQDEIANSYRLMDFRGHLLHPNLRSDVEFYARELKSVGQLRADLDIPSFVQRAFWDTAA